jgi:hypothetical protein
MTVCARDGCEQFGQIICQSCGETNYCSRICLIHDETEHLVHCSQTLRNAIQHLLFLHIVLRTGRRDKTYEEFMEAQPTLPPGILAQQMECWLENEPQRQLRQMAEQCELVWTPDFYPLYQTWVSGWTGGTIEKSMIEFLTMAQHMFHKN